VFGMLRAAADYSICSHGRYKAQVTRFVRAQTCPTITQRITHLAIFWPFKLNASSKFHGREKRKVKKSKGEIQKGNLNAYLLMMLEYILCTDTYAIKSINQALLLCA